MRDERGKGAHPWAEGQRREAEGFTTTNGPQFTPSTPVEQMFFSEPGEEIRATLDVRLPRVVRADERWHGFANDLHYWSRRDGRSLKILVAQWITVQIDDTPVEPPNAVILQWHPKAT
jgi:hypothetical protein